MRYSASALKRLRNPPLHPQLSRRLGVSSVLRMRGRGCVLRGDLERVSTVSVSALNACQEDATGHANPGENYLPIGSGIEVIYRWNRHEIKASGVLFVG